jgi:predicted 3-demethylubiquinone-9 3-methyltransferase (glyoxalase superfamily)
MQKITPFLWFNDNAEEAIQFYSTVFKDSKLVSVNRMGGKFFGATFELNGQQFMAMNAGPMFKFTEAISLYVNCETQEEVDYYWNKLTADGGQESRCGWLKDKYGLSWQIIPSALGKLIGDPDPARAGAAMQAMLKMNKIIIKDLQAAYDKG